jgi:hypothetical protein
MLPIANVNSLTIKFYLFEQKHKHDYLIFLNQKNSNCKLNYNFQIVVFFMIASFAAVDSQEATLDITQSTPAPILPYNTLEPASQTRGFIYHAQTFDQTPRVIAPQAPTAGLVNSYALGGYSYPYGLQGYYNQALPSAYAGYNPYVSSASPYLANPYAVNPYVTNPYVTNSYAVNPYFANQYFTNPYSPASGFSQASSPVTVETSKPSDSNQDSTIVEA